MTVQPLKKGFTLIELLIVIAVLGVLATVLIVALSPVEQLARGRDAGRKSAIGQLGTSLSAYYAGKIAYPAEAAAWMTDLQTSGEIASPLSVTAATNTCTNAAAGNICYDLTAGVATIWTPLESASDKGKVTGCAAVGNQPSFAWRSDVGKAGYACAASATAAPTSIQ